MVELVLRAANLLNVDELEVFRLSDRYWHHRTNDIKAAFRKYLTKKIVPYWVLHFARTVVKAYECGDLEPLLFGVYPSYERIQLTWALAFRTPLSLPLNDSDGLLVA